MDWWFIEAEQKVLVKNDELDEHRLTGGGVVTLKCLVRADDPAGALDRAMEYWRKDGASMLEVKVKPFHHDVLAVAAPISREGQS